MSICDIASDVIIQYSAQGMTLEESTSSSMIHVGKSVEILSDSADIKDLQNQVIQEKVQYV